MFSKTSFFVLLVTLSTSALAQSGDDYVGYDSIVNDLTASTRAPQIRSRDPFDLIEIHGGFGLVTSHTTISTANGESFSGFQKGFEASLGIDLFSPRWMAEGALRSFSSTQLEKGAYASLNEFNLRVLYRNPVSRLVRLRMGVGVAARYMELKINKASGAEKQDFSTPASILSIGLEAAISRNLSVGAEVAYRSALITDTADSEAADATLSLGAHF